MSGARAHRRWLAHGSGEQRAHRQRRVAQPAATQPDELAPVDVKLVRRAAQGQQSLLRLLAERRFHERDIQPMPVLLNRQSGRQEHDGNAAEPVIASLASRV